MHIWHKVQVWCRYNPSAVHVQVLCYMHFCPSDIAQICYCLQIKLKELLIVKMVINWLLHLMKFLFAPFCFFAYIHFFPSDDSKCAGL